jgi:hypothetical protein
MYTTANNSVKLISKKNRNKKNQIVNVKKQIKFEKKIESAEQFLMCLLEECNS